MSLAITFTGVLSLVAIVSAFQLGRQQERPRNKWPPGGLFDGGWAAWRIPFISIVAVAAAAIIVLPLMNAGMFRGLLPSLSFGRGYRGNPYQQQQYGGAGYSAGYQQYG